MLEFQRIVNERRFADFPFAYADAKIDASPLARRTAPRARGRPPELGRTDAARADVDWLFADDMDRLPFDFNWMSALGELGEALAALGDAPRAEQLYARGLPYADRAVTSGRAIGSQGSVSHTLGRLAATAGRAGHRGRRTSAPRWTHRRGWTRARGRSTRARAWRRPCARAGSRRRRSASSRRRGPRPRRSASRAPSPEPSGAP